MSRLNYVVFGTLFGFILSRSGATNFDAIHGMFLLEDLHLMGVIGVAVALAAAGFAVIRARGMRGVDGEPMTMKKKPMKPGLVTGGILFGAGWAITGTCPGTGLAQIGEGTLTGGIVVLGIFAGAYLQSKWAKRTASKSQSVLLRQDKPQTQSRQPVNAMGG